MNINGIEIEFGIEQTDEDYFFLVFLYKELWYKFNYFKWEEWDLFGEIKFEIEKYTKSKLNKDDYFLLLDEVNRVYDEMGDYVVAKDGSRTVIYKDKGDIKK